MLTGKVFVELALLYGVACCLCMTFSVCILYVFSDPSEDRDGRTLNAMLTVLGIVTTVLVVSSYMVQEF